MAEPVLRQGQWWQQRNDGAWLRWDPAAQRWDEQDGPPPPADASDVQPVSTPQANGIEPYRSPQSLSRTLLIFLGIGLGLDIAAVGSGLAERSLLERAQGGELITFSEADSNDTRQMVVGIAQAAMFVATIPVFIIWFRRLYRNLPALGARNLRFKPGWAVGAWFVPILNLFRPVQITYDIWKASEPDMSEAPDTPWRTQRNPALIGFWWAAWVISNWTAQIAFRLDGNSDDLDSIVGASLAWVIADSASVIATILAIALVWRMTARHQRRARRLAAAGALTGPP